MRKIARQSHGGEIKRIAHLRLESFDATLAKHNLIVSPESKYSAARSHSFTVADGPRFNSTGFFTVASRRNSAKFCIFAGSHLQHVHVLANDSTSSVLITSVTTGRPESSRASCRIFSASSPSP